MVVITPASPHFLALQPQPGPHLNALLEEPVILREHSDNDLKNANRFFQRLGISFISQLAARQFPEDGLLLMFPLPEQSSRRELYLTYGKTRRPRPTSGNSSAISAAIVSRDKITPRLPQQTGLLIQLA